MLNKLRSLCEGFLNVKRAVLRPLEIPSAVFCPSKIFPTGFYGHRFFAMPRACCVCRCECMGHACKCEIWWVRNTKAVCYCWILNTYELPLEFTPFPTEGDISICVD